MNLNNHKRPMNKHKSISSEEDENISRKRIKPISLFDPASFKDIDYSEISDSDDSNQESIKLVKSGDIAGEIVNEDFIVSDDDAEYLDEAEENLDENEQIQLNLIRQSIEDNTPSLSKILKSNLSNAEKERVVQLYDIVTQSDLADEYTINLTAKLNNILKNTPTTDNINKELEELRSKIVYPTPEKIVTAFLTDKDKIRALQLYESFQQAEYHTEHWFSLQKRINDILDSQLSSVEAVKEIEEQEKLYCNITESFQKDLKQKILQLDTNNNVKAILLEMYTNMLSYDPEDNNYSTLKNKLNWYVKLPHNRLLPMPQNLHEIYDKLNAELYGMKEVKEKIMTIINDRIYNPKSKSILALYGKPGVGKTKLAKTIAKAVNLPFEKINLGGSTDSSIFKGNDNVWIGSSPSILMQKLTQVKCSNPLILLDEVDKLGASSRGQEVQNALLHVLDATQNNEFQDSFLSDYPHDLSSVWFVLSMNHPEDLDPTLRDRLNLIEVPTYDKNEMIEIIIRHTLPETLIDKGLLATDISISREACKMVITGVNTRSAGMRAIEHVIADMVSKINLWRSFQDVKFLSFKLKDFKGFPYVISEETVKELVIGKKSECPFYII